MGASTPQKWTPSVLVIDDDPAVRQMVQDVLDGDERVNVVGAAPDAVAGLELAGQLRPEVVILDHQMPVLSGLDILPRLRATLPDAQIVLWTSGDASSDEATSLGATACVMKAVPIDDVIDLVLYERGLSGSGPSAEQKPS